jgi:hypothetical protein
MTHRKELEALIAKARSKGAEVTVTEVDGWIEERMREVLR